MLNQLSDNPLLLWASLLPLVWFTFKKEPSHKMKGKHYPRTPPPSPHLGAADRPAPLRERRARDAAARRRVPRRARQRQAPGPAG